MRKILFLTICILTFVSCSSDDEITKVERILADVETVTLPVPKPDDELFPSYHLKISTLPSEYHSERYKYEYSSSDENVFIVDPFGVILPVSKGNATLTVVFAYNKSITTTVNVIVK